MSSVTDTPEHLCLILVPRQHVGANIPMNLAPARGTSFQIPGVKYMWRKRVQRLSQDNLTRQRRAWLLLGLMTVERSCPCKQLASPAVVVVQKSPLCCWSPVFLCKRNESLLNHGRTSGMRLNRTIQTNPENVPQHRRNSKQSEKLVVKQTPDVGEVGGGGVNDEDVPGSPGGFLRVLRRGRLTPAIRHLIVRHVNTSRPRLYSRLGAATGLAAAGGLSSISRPETDTYRPTLCLKGFDQPEILFVGF
ncbi:hypothetical protein J6590_007049 [Homalodisca vitripennis]|nr:hypothetical protein J6590_007049 [Homalodisca vitripennis]